MNRLRAHTICKEKLTQYELTDWGVRLSNNANDPFLGMCMYQDKIIILNAHYIDILPDAEILNTINHEVAHAIVGPGHGHNSFWVDKAKEVGCDNTLPCSHLNLPAHVIDAIRSGQMVEMVVEEETHVIRTPKYKVTRLQDKCPECGKVAIEKFSCEAIDKNGDSVKLITLACFHIIKKVIPRGTPFESMISNYWKPEIQACTHTFPTRSEAKISHIPPNRCEKCGEFKLYDFQLVGARFAESALATQKGAGIFDDMGLGKTVQALGIVRFHKEYTPTLYIVKSAIKFQWSKQIVRWLGPDYFAQIIHTSKDFLFVGLKSYIISYDLLKRFPAEKLAKLGIKLVVMDECQQIKNPDSTRTQVVRKLVGSNPAIKVLPLSGTPWKNRGGEFYPVLNMIDPVKFYSYQNYLDTWVDFYYEGSKKKEGGIRNPKRFREYTSGLLIRREYNEVMDEFPDINRMKLNVQLDELSQDTYDEEVSEFVKWYNEAVIGGEEDSLNSLEILAKLSRMRHITGLAKIPATLTAVEEFIENTDKKLVVFVHHKDVGELLYSEIKKLHGETVEVVKLTAEFSDAERFEIQERFNKSKRTIMVASTLASGEGIDLQTCADCIMHERQWNPQNEDQAAPGRFRRIGQLAGVINITFAEAEDTVDEHLDAIVERKRVNFHTVMNKGESIKWNQDGIAKELAEIIVRKHREKKAKSGTAATKSITKAATLNTRIG